jgi:hypothetical protein
MPTLLCTLGTDPMDADLNRPALVLPAPEYARLVGTVRAEALPTLALLLGGDGVASRRTIGASQFPALRAEVQAALAGIAAAQLPTQLLVALSLQQFASLCDTAQELGLNIYVVQEDDEQEDE